MYIVRADGNASIGAGHLMRCLTIVDALVSEAKSMAVVGEMAEAVSVQEVLFVCADEASAALVRERGYQCFVTNTDYCKMEDELSVLTKLMEELEGKHVFLVDSYYVSDVYLDRLRQWGKVMLLDDMQQHAFPVDVVVNYNAFADTKVYENLYKNKATKCYAGAEFVPTRPQFVNVEYEVRDAVGEILITTGGGDLDNIAGQMLEKIYNNKLNYHLITGRFNPHLEELKELEKRGNVRISYDVKDMASCMKASDIAITAGGTTIYELAAIGVPFICFSYAENQEALTEYVGRQGIAGYAGAYHKDAQEALGMMANQFAEMCQDKTKRNACYEKEKVMVDGQGASRLARVWSNMSRNANG